LALPSWLFPFEVLALVAATSNVFSTIVLLTQWGSTPPYTYVPKKQRRPPDRFRQFLTALFVFAALLLERQLAAFSATNQSRLRRRTSSSKQSLTKRHSFKLRGGGSEPKLHYSFLHTKFK
jgi:hypothetical protein